MEKRKVGSLEVSLAGLGCNNFGWRIDAQATAKVVDAAIDAGINFFDTADMYGSGQSEEYLGKALGARRSQVLIATKFGSPMGEGKSGAKPHYIRQALEDSLRRLGTDYVDLYQIHRPDDSTPIADTMGALKELIAAGKVREIGCSNFSVAQLREAGPGFVSVQNDYSLLKREAEKDVLPECSKLGIAFLPYFPLANGLLSGKYHSGESLPEGSRAKDGWGPKNFSAENIAMAERLAKFAASKGRTLLELAMSWLASRPQVSSIIAGAKTAEQVTANAAAVAWKLSAAEIAEAEALL